jgi:hypothetical protein
MEKNLLVNGMKPKSIIIDGTLHYRFKILCKGKSMKIGGVIEDLIQLYLDKPKDMQKLIDEVKEKERLQVGAFKPVGEEQRIKS